MPIYKKSFSKPFLSLVIIFSVFLPYTFPALANGSEDFIFSNKDLISLTRPAVVRIATEIEGDISMEPFTIDFDNIDIVRIKSNNPEWKKKEHVKETFLGTGFVINPDGYILTNAHVVTEDLFKAVFGTIVLYFVTVDEAYNQRLTEKEAIEFEKRVKNLTDEEQGAFSRKLLDLVNFENLNIKITVLKPETESKNIDNYIKEGFPAEIIKFDEDFLFNDKDVALIKINEKNLPAIKLAEKSNVEIGDEVFTFGFPASADISTQSFLNASFTEGTVSALKQSRSKSFSIIQTDAKISKGSSGSPLINKDGDVIGIVTAQSKNNSLGDNFAFGIPIEVANELIKKENVKNIEGDFQKSFKEGLLLKNKKHCKKAIESFNSGIENTNPYFVKTINIDSYLQECKDLIASGKSIDSKFDEIKEKAKSFGWFFWAVIFGTLVLGVLLMLATMYFVEKIKKNRKEINTIEDMLARKKMQPFNNNLTKGLKEENKVDEKPNIDTTSNKENENTPVPVNVDQNVVKFIRSQREAGVSDDIIRDKLKNEGGWTDEDINTAFSAV